MLRTLKENRHSISKLGKVFNCTTYVRTYIPILRKIATLEATLNLTTMLLRYYLDTAGIAIDVGIVLSSWAIDRGS